MILTKHSYFPANEEDKVNLLFICQFSKVWARANKHLKNKIDIILEVQKSHIRWCANKKIYQQAGKEVLAKLISQPNYIKSWKTKVKKTSDDLISFSTKVQRTDLTKLSDIQLVQLINRQDQLYTRMIYYGILPAIVEVPIGQFTNYLYELLNNKSGKFRMNQSVADYFKTLTQIDFWEAAKKELIDRLKIASLVKSKKDLNDEKIKKLIKQHTAKYFWINYAYQGPILTELFFKKEIIKDLKRQPAKKLVLILKEIKEIKKRRLEAEKKLKLTKKEKQIFVTAHECIFLKLYRKDALTYSLAVMEKALREISRRTGYNLAQIRHCLTEEIPLLFKNQKFKTELNCRIKQMVYYLKDNKLSEPIVLTGKKAKKFINRVLIKVDFSRLREFKGTCASPGFAQGKVKIINVAKDMAKMNLGDVLVSIATIPEIVPAMKKASAIIADIGGITSHAAIVSRELKKPCVIGTSIATKVLKDGDLVEVDADRGIVKIIKKN